MAPEYLHCYFSYEDGIDFLTTRRFRLSSMSEFNDPFEFLPKTDYPLFFLSLNKYSTPVSIKMKVDRLRNDNLFVCGERVTRKAKAFVGRMNLFRIGCFSEVDDNILMWSHYCRKHTGILVTFKTAWDYWGNDFHQVNYSDEPLDIEDNDVCLAGDNSQKKLLTQKASCWSYEKEWRYIKCSHECLQDGPDSYYKEVNLRSIVKIVVGCKISEENLINCLRVVKNNFPDVPVFEADPSARSYSLEMNRII